MKKLFIYLLLGVLAATAHAEGGLVGNGGDVVVCRNSDNSIRSIELLDFYEARIQRGQTINLNPELSVDENIAIYLERLGSRDVYQKNQVEALYNSFNKEANFLPGVELVDVSDSNHIAFPAGCKVEQIAIQRIPQYPKEKRYTINKDLWDQLSNSDRAGLIIHEIIYRSSVDTKSEVNSIPTRYFNSIIASDDLKLLKPSEYFDLLNQNFILHTSWGEWIVDPATSRFEKEKLLSATAYFENEQEVTINNDVTVKVDADSEVTIEFSNKVENQIELFWWKASKQTIEVNSHKLKIDGIRFFPVKLHFVGGKLSSITEDAIYVLKEEVFNVPKEFLCRKFKFIDKDRESFSCEDLEVKTYPQEKRPLVSLMSTFGPNQKLATAEFSQFDSTHQNHYKVSYYQTGYPRTMECLLDAEHKSCIVDVKYKGQFTGSHVWFHNYETVEFDSQGNYLRGGQFYEEND